MRPCLFTILFLLACISIKAQEQTITFQVKDEVSELPIEAVHVFLQNSTIGSITDAQGKCRLSWPKNFAGQLVVSHIGYENLSLSVNGINFAEGLFTILLKANNSRFDEVLVTATRDSKWKRYFKNFRKTLLGEGREAEKSKILNPEVLRFESDKGRFLATAVGPLKIRNDYLGYHIEYLLNELIIEVDGSKSYKGQASFTDLYESNIPNAIAKKREKVFIASRRHFFQTLIRDELEIQPYEISINTYSNGYFIQQSMPDRNQLLSYDKASGFYHFYFSDFIQIINLNFKNFIDEESKKITGIESSRFNSTQSGGITKLDFAVSQLYKLSPYLILDPYGNVYNSSEVKEYGFWADQRLASMLPLNYKIENELVIGATETHRIGLEQLKNLVYGSKTEQLSKLTEIEERWRNEYYAPLLEIVRLSNDEWLVDKVSKILEEKSDGGIVNYYNGLKWLWNKAYEYSDDYSDFKAELNKHSDPKFEKYFKGRSSLTTIRLDEVIWGGVQQDGIPPLRYPKMLSAKEGEYLEDDNVVFGFYINGEARAYPKRILAWHEFFVDDFGETKIAGVYCTLCGTVIAYDMSFENQFHDLGTSGFLYRSNKLMYDRETQSLWNTIEGKPVVGPLIGKGIELKNYPVVTTSWGEWKKIHPATTVLSLETGHQRNYKEGEAYKEYYDSDELMFPVPNSDTRLKNKAEVLVIKSKNYQQDPFAISVDYLKRKNLYQDSIYGNAFLVIAENDGLAKVYEADDIKFKNYKKGILLDEEGGEWVISEEGLESPTGKYLKRLPSHNIFWFAWLNAFPNTKLVH